MFDSTSFQVCGSRVDWITATAPIGEGARELFDQANALRRRRAADGAHATAWRFMGYEGVKTDGLAVGWRPDSAIVCAESDAAAECWRQLYATGARVTRFDIAVDAAAAAVPDDFVYSNYLAFRAAQQTTPRRTEGHVELYTDGSATLYCGSRASERFGRLYDKSRQSHSPVPPNTFRWELEYKGGAARSLASLLGTTSADEYPIASLVRQRFTRWGIEPGWNAPGRAWRDTAKRSPTDAERTLMWFEDDVSKTVQRLGMTYSAEEIARRLGLWTIRPPIGSDGDGLREGSNGSR